jgi:hypothetical protein
MAPTVRVLVYFLVDDEIVADSLSFDVEGAFQNFVSLALFVEYLNYS